MLLKLSIVLRLVKQDPAPSNGPADMNPPVALSFTIADEPYGPTEVRLNTPGPGSISAMWPTLPIAYTLPVLSTSTSPHSSPWVPPIAATQIKLPCVFNLRTYQSS